MCIDWPAREPGCIERNRWCCPHYKTNLPTGMRKGSVVVRDLAVKGFNAMLMADGQKEHWS